MSPKSLSLIECRAHKPDVHEVSKQIEATKLAVDVVGIDTQQRKVELFGKAILAVIALLLAFVAVQWAVDLDGK